MNVYTCHGVIKGIEIKGDSFLVLIHNAPDRIDESKSIQATRKFVIRYPKENYPIDKGFKVEDTVECFAHINGIVKRNSLTSEQYSYAQIIGKTMTPVSVVNESERSKAKFFNRFDCIGIPKHLHVPDDPNKPLLLFVQITAHRERPKKEDEKAFRRTDTIPVNIFGKAKEKILKLNAEDRLIMHGLSMTGHVTGLIALSPNGSGKKLQHELHPQVNISHVEYSVSIPTSMTSPVAFLEGHDEVGE